MRGWRRLGVVLSVIWFIGFGAWMWITSTDNLGKDYQSSLGFCYSIGSMEREPIRWDDPQAQQRLAVIESQEKACRQRASEGFHQGWEHLKSQSWLIVLVDVVSIVLFWLVALIIVSVGRWVAIGFRT